MACKAVRIDHLNGVLISDSFEEIHWPGLNRQGVDCYDEEKNFLLYNNAGVYGRWEMGHEIFLSDRL